MSAINDGGPAYPNKDELGNMIPGMSLRDWFAGQETLEDIRDDLSGCYFDALAGCPMPLPPRGKILSAFDYIEIAQWDARWRATLKYIRADAMLRARERVAGVEAENKQAREDEAWANDRTVLVEFQPVTSGWYASAPDGVVGISATAPTIHGALRALREKMEAKP